MTTTELDALSPVTDQVTLADGTRLQLERLRSRQFFKLLRILTHGAGSALSDLFRLDPDEPAEAFGARLVSMIVLSIPDAEDETIEFLRSMAQPVGLIEGRALNKADSERNKALWQELDRALYNPDLDDLVSLIEAIVRRESDDIQALGKRLAAMFKLAQKVGQVPAPRNQTSPTATSSAGSPGPSTSSPPSTDGPTSTSATSPSAGSDSASPPSANGATTPSGDDSNG